MSLDADEVTIERYGDGLLIRPRRRAGWRYFFGDETMRLPTEFERPEQPPDQDRLP